MRFMAIVAATCVAAALSVTSAMAEDPLTGALRAAWSKNYDEARQREVQEEEQGKAEPGEEGEESQRLAPGIPEGMEQGERIEPEEDGVTQAGADQRREENPHPHGRHAQPRPGGRVCSRRGLPTLFR